MGSLKAAVAHLQSLNAHHPARVVLQRLGQDVDAIDEKYGRTYYRVVLGGLAADAYANDMAAAMADMTDRLALERWLGVGPFAEHAIATDPGWATYAAEPLIQVA